MKRLTLLMPLVIWLAACSIQTAQQPVSTPTSAYQPSINIMLMDSGVRYVCYPVYDVPSTPSIPLPTWTPNDHPVFQTATAINATLTAQASITPTSTTIPLPTETPPPLPPTPTPDILPEPTPTIIFKVVTAPSGLNVRECPGTTCVIIGRLGYNSQIAVSGATQNVGGVVWWQLANGGWVSGQYLQ